MGPPPEFSFPPLFFPLAFLPVGLLPSPSPAMTHWLCRHPIESQHLKRLRGFIASNGRPFLKRSNQPFEHRQTQTLEFLVNRAVVDAILNVERAEFLQRTEITNTQTAVVIQCNNPVNLDSHCKLCNLRGIFPTNIQTKHRRLQGSQKSGVLVTSSGFFHCWKFFSSVGKAFTFALIVKLHTLGPTVTTGTEDSGPCPLFYGSFSSGSLEPFLGFHFCRFQFSLLRFIP